MLGSVLRIYGVLVVQGALHFMYSLGFICLPVCFVCLSRIISTFMPWLCGIDISLLLCALVTAINATDTLMDTVLCYLNPGSLRKQHFRSFIKSHRPLLYERGYIAHIWFDLWSHGNLSWSSSIILEISVLKSVSSLDVTPQSHIEECGDFSSVYKHEYYY